MESHTIAGGDGVNLYVEETGNENGQPILSIHGYSQSQLSWGEQMNSALRDDFQLVAMDNRGHGNSEKPRNAYDDSELWADDVHSVIDTLGLDEPVLVGWSYGGLIIADYLATYDEDEIAGINLVGAISKFSTEEANAVIGEKFLELVPGFESTDAEESVEALKTVVRRVPHGELAPPRAVLPSGIQHNRPTVRPRGTALADGNPRRPLVEPRNTGVHLPRRRGRDRSPGRRRRTRRTHPDRTNVVLSRRWVCCLLRKPRAVQSRTTGVRCRTVVCILPRVVTSLKCRIDAAHQLAMWSVR